MQIKNFCKPTCYDAKFLAHISFYNLESDVEEGQIRNRFTIYYDSYDYLVMSEKSARDDIGMFVYLGGVWIVYTGMSAAAVVHAVALIVYLG